MAGQNPMNQLEIWTQDTQGNTFRRLGILGVVGEKPGSEDWEGRGLQEAQHDGHRKGVAWTSHGDPGAHRTQLVPAWLDSTTSQT